MILLFVEWQILQVNLISLSHPKIVQNLNCTTPSRIVHQIYYGIGKSHQFGLNSQNFLDVLVAD